jgi:hypothetical protein
MIENKAFWNKKGIEKLGIRKCVLFEYFLWNYTQRVLIKEPTQILLPTLK